VLTYTLSILVNKCATLIVMGAGLIMTGHAVLTPLLQALSMLTGDLVTMSRAPIGQRRRPIPMCGAFATSPLPRFRWAC
jgi:H+-transporting ATPase